LSTTAKIQEINKTLDAFIAQFKIPAPSNGDEGDDGALDECEPHASGDA
jgi:hypothetical protein